MSGNVAQVSDIAHSPLVFKLIQQSQYIFFHIMYGHASISRQPQALCFFKYRMVTALMLKLHDV